MKKCKNWSYMGLLCLVLLIAMSYSGKTAKASAMEEGLKSLPKVGSYDNLKKILAQAQNIMPEAKGLETMDQTREASSSQKVPEPSGSYSQTNVQVQGVDEADTVKTDGEFIYMISDRKVLTIKAKPEEHMKVMSALAYPEGVNPQEIYIDSGHLTVILNTGNYWLGTIPESGKQSAPESGKQICPPPFLENSTKVIVYNLLDGSPGQKIREVELDGNYLSSRKIGQQLYLVNNKSIPVYLLNETGRELLLPAYRDSEEGGQVTRIGYDRISYFPGASAANYLLVADINLSAEKKTEVSTYLGSGQDIYCSADSLYVAVPEYRYSVTSASQASGDVPAGALVKPSLLPTPREENTTVYKFSLKNDGTVYQGSGKVTGRILNQFSMDENNGFFRIATTANRYSSNDGAIANNLYVLDQDMKVTGKIENIAPGEKIYSVRFIGSRGYMVTFQTVDPLFVLDLKDPAKPRILGELKIPGYSNYLHPYDENHILGFGKEAVEIEEPHWSGQGTVKNAYYLGMKIALFDVSDVSNPKEEAKVVIGDRGTDSELFWNHKALLFSKEKNLLAFPVTVCDIDPATVNKDDYLVKKDPRLAYGTPVFQGAFVYKLTLEKGFELQRMVTHQPAGKIGEMQRTGKYDSNRDISRVLYIDNTLYTVSNSYLQANDLISLQERGGLDLEK